ncbi:O-Glycosyl hydrolases family 17 protein [Striga hermonthica]|uniref:O-Glycosyl hydrolases family 17 protein n=1 Tax=Striga hermonthica TaxID=68872 RepID=A0A9N7NW49_STRHE|nr:O-Glycosyl hydrolases family 17 protein [Striga hermonthica]
MKMATTSWVGFMLLATLSITGHMAEGLGVNWGTQAAQNLNPGVVAQLLRDNKINKVKLFDSDAWTVNFFKGMDIEVMLGIPNNQLSSLARDYDKAKDWVKNHVAKHLYNGGVNIKYVAVGNEPFLKAYNGLYQNPDFPIEFAFFDGGATPVEDDGITYTNMLDANLDTLVWALKKAGAPKVRITIGEIGWPTDGHTQANVKMAKRFYQGFLKKMAEKKGSPLYKDELEYYLFSLTDENQKSIAPGDFERHWGIYRYDGQPKYPIDFTGKGNDRMPVPAKNVPYMEQKWCVLNGDIKNLDKMPANMNFACSNGDCTALGPGCSCNGLDKQHRISYAFNNYFQINNQDVRACNFEGLAKISSQNVSTGQCFFPIALQDSGGWKLGMHAWAGVLSGVLALFVLLF